MKLFNQKDSVKKITQGIIIITIFFLLLIVCRKEADHVTVKLDWIHGVHFIGYYTSIEKGFYAKEGLSVTLNEGGPIINEQVLSAFYNSNAEFGVFNMSNIISSAKTDNKITAIMRTFQIPPYVLFSLKESKIESPENVIGKRVGIKSQRWKEMIRSTLINAGIDPAEIIEVEAKSIDMLYSGEIDIWTGYTHNEPNEARISGYRINEIFTADYNVGTYSGLLIAHQKMIDQDPDLIIRFVRASLNGWIYSLEHPEEAAEILNKWQPSKNIEFHRLAVQSIIPLLEIGYSPFGWINENRWKREMGDVYDPDNPGFTMKFIQTSEK
ncbi:MAG: ABC transporter substrate-binding protein [Spirochaetales bacterium]|nr:ABC transporter substrate-binding protein [Spirochaetales bacterium]